MFGYFILFFFEKKRGKSAIRINILESFTVYFILLFHVTIFFDRNLYSIRSFNAFPSLSFFWHSQIILI